MGRPRKRRKAKDPGKFAGKTPEARAAQLANLTPAPPAYARAGPGNQRHASPFLHTSRLLVRDVEAEVRELMDALGDAVPVKEQGGVPAADVVVVEVAARALKRYRHVSAALDVYGRIDPVSMELRPAAVMEPRLESALMDALDALGMTPRSRAKLGLDVMRSFDLAQHWAAEPFDDDPLRVDVVEEAEDG